MDQTYTDIAVMRSTNEIIAVGNSLRELIANADATGIWNRAPGTVAPYFYTSAKSTESWNAGAWFAPGFWAKQNS